MAREHRQDPPLTWGMPFSATWADGVPAARPTPHVTTEEHDSWEAEARADWQAQAVALAWEDGVPAEARAAWQADAVHATGVAWDDWSREQKESRPAAVPIAIMAVLAAAVVAAFTAGPAPVGGQPVAGAAAPERPAPTTTAVPTTTTTTPAPAATQTPAASPPPAPPPRQESPPPPQAANTVRLAHGGTATLVRRDVVDGVLPVPDGVREATWWGAPFDGQTGATVLAGHVNWKGATGPFSELWDARLGDQVTVIDDQGRPFTYVVSQLVTVHKNDLPNRAQELFGQEGAHRLVLVTCGGRWVGGHDGYEENRVVIAAPAA